MNTLTRNEAYAKSKAGNKEAKGLQVFNDFMANVLNTEATFITSYTENWQYGDYKLSNGKYIEVKSQPINPYKYAKNFVELGELTDNTLHADGYNKLESILDLDKPLSEVRVYDKPTKELSKLGTPDALSVSITSMGNGSSYAYVNSSLEIVFLYSAKTLLGLINKELKYGTPIIKGAGDSHKNTLGLLVDNATAAWHKQNGVWTFIGTANEQAVIDWLVA